MSYKLIVDYKKYWVKDTGKRVQLHIDVDKGCSTVVEFERNTTSDQLESWIKLTPNINRLPKVLFSIK